MIVKGPIQLNLSCTPYQKSSGYDHFQMTGSFFNDAIIIVFQMYGTIYTINVRHFCEKEYKINLCICTWEYFIWYYCIKLWKATRPYYILILSLNCCHLHADYIISLGIVHNLFYRHVECSYYILWNLVGILCTQLNVTTLFWCWKCCHLLLIYFIQWASEPINKMISIVHHVTYRELMKHVFSQEFLLF